MAPSISFPPSGSVAIETLNGSNWPSWSSRITVLLRMNGLKKHITDTKDSNDTGEWDSKEEIILGVLEMYCQKDVPGPLSQRTTLLIQKSKHARRNGRNLSTHLHGGIGSMSSFNTWVALMSTALDNSTPDAPPTTHKKLTDARLTPWRIMDMESLRSPILLHSDQSLTRHLLRCRLDYLSVRRAERSISSEDPRSDSQ